MSGALTYMAENTGFVDPLDNIIRKTKEAYGIPDDVSTPTVNKTPPAVDIDIEDEEDDDIYGVHDFEKELEEEERQMKEEEEARKQAILAERRANEKPVEKMPADHTVAPATDDSKLKFGSFSRVPDPSPEPEKPGELKISLGESRPEPNRIPDPNSRMKPADDFDD